MSFRKRPVLAAVFLAFLAAPALGQTSGEEQRLQAIAERLEPARAAASEACGADILLAFDPGSLQPSQSPLAQLSACRAAFDALSGYCAEPEARASVASSLAALLCQSGERRFISLSDGILRFHEEPGGGDSAAFVRGFLDDAL